MSDATSSMKPFEIPKPPPFFMSAQHRIYIFPSSVHANLSSVIVNLSSYLSALQIINSLNASILVSSLCPV